MKGLLIYIKFYGSRIINIRVVDSFTPSHNSINVPGLPYLVYKRYPVDRQGRQVAKSFILAVLKTKKLLNALYNIKIKRKTTNNLVKYL